MISCGSKSKNNTSSDNEIQNQVQKDTTIILGANQTEKYLSLLNGKHVAVVANQTSVIFNEKGYTHLVDSLISLKVDVKKIFSPEHGFRGKGDAGELIDDSKDTKTGLPIISLHGKNRKPTKKQLEDIDIVLFDIQDVGVRFYTYLSTMHYVMEASAEANIPLIVLDRPNPNANYIDGPVLDLAFKSFVGMHPVPLVYGMTIGEYAKMINGEGWLENNVLCDLTVITLKNYIHVSPYSLPIKPSPNLPNDKAINLYPSLDLFRGTTINAGRGTNYQLQCYGAPFFPKSDFSYTPESNEGAKHPRFEGKLCYGVDLRNEPTLDHLTLKYIIDAFNKTPKEETFFGSTFTAHAGNEILQKQIESGMTEYEIKATWQEDLENFKKIRAKYLLYP